MTEAESLIGLKINPQWFESWLQSFLFVLKFLSTQEKKSFNAAPGIFTLISCPR
jgi:hypothetical protein